MIDQALARWLLDTMCLIRAFEEKVSELVAAGHISGLVHSSVGQEGVAAGVCAQLLPDDYVYSGHRAHGHFLARGADPGAMMAELAGRTTGLCHGKGGSMHLVDMAHGLLGATGVVGGNVPLALGTALAAKERGRGQVALVFFGDGAAQTGYFLESLNLASLWKLPVLLVCENNGYAEFTPRSAHTNVERVARLAETYAIPSATVDGNDVRAVHDAAVPLLAGVRRGEGPALLECLTYRLRGHYEGDPAKYREATELAEWKTKDPIARLVRFGRESRLISEEDAHSAEATARRRVEAAARSALEAPLPRAADLVTDVRA